MKYNSCGRKIVIVFYIVAYNTLLRLMKTNLKQGRMVAELRKIIGKSQSQFAAMLGVSKDTIISVENGRNQLSKKLEARIFYATGASFRETEGFDGLKGYTREEFDKFREYVFQTDEETARDSFDKVKFWIEIVLRAAGQPGLAGNRDRLPAVCFSLAEWLNEARVNFKLGPEIDKLLEEESRFIQRDCEYVGVLKVDDEQAREFAETIGVDYKDFKKELSQHRDSDLVMVKYECFRAWSPWSNNRTGKPKTPKLMQKPKYWFKRLPDAFVVNHGRPITASELAKLDSVKRVSRPKKQSSQS